MNDNDRRLQRDTPNALVKIISGCFSYVNFLSLRVRFSGNELFYYSIFSSTISIFEHYFCILL